MLNNIWLKLVYPSVVSDGVETLAGLFSSIVSCTYNVIDSHLPEAYAREWLNCSTKEW